MTLLHYFRVAIRTHLCGRHVGPAPSPPVGGVGPIRPPPEGFSLRAAQRGSSPSGSAARHALRQQVVAAGVRLRALLHHLPAVRRAGFLQHRAAGGGRAAPRHAAAEGSLPEPELRQRRDPGAVPQQSPGRQQARRVRPPELLRQVQLGLGLLHVLRQHAGHHRGVRPPRAPLRRWESVLHRLRADRRPLHHAGADRLRPEDHAASGPGAGRPPAARRPQAAAGHRRPLPAAPAGGGAVLLPGAGRRVQRAGGVLDVPGQRLLLLHIAVHHRAGGLRPGGAARPAVQSAVPGGRHGLPVHWSDDDVPPTADLPQDGRRPRPDHVLPAAALRGVSAGRRHGADHRRRPDSASPERQGRHQTSGSGIPTVVQLHQQRLSRRRRRGERIYLWRAAGLNLNSCFNFLPEEST